MTGMLSVVAIVLIAADVATTDLLADVRLAMKRADLSIDYVARCCGVPPAKLSHQLSGRLPFTYCWRIFANAEIRGTEFWVEFLRVSAERFDHALVSSSLGQLVASVTELVEVAKRKPMAKMGLRLEPNAKVS